MKSTEEIQEKRFIRGIMIPLAVLVISAIAMSLSQRENDAVRVSYDPAPTKHYMKTGSSSTAPTLRMLQTRVFHVMGVVPTVSNAGSLDVSWLSGLGVTTIVDVMVTATRSTATPNDVPTVSINSRSLSAITYNITQGNNATVAILGINVLSGTPNVFVPTGSLSGITLDFLITAY